jgi:hypothetical protein
MYGNILDPRRRKESKMDKIKSNTDNPKKQADEGRRSFMWKAGAAMSAVLATAVPSVARTSFKKDTNLKAKVERLSKQVGLLEDEKAVRSLHRTYENHLNCGEYEEILNLFADDAEVIFNGGVFKGKKSGIHRLYCSHFNSGLTGKKMDPAPGFQLNAEQHEDFVEIALDRSSANARFTYSIQVGTPIKSDSQLITMARLQGEAIMKWWEGGVYEVVYVKDIKVGNWKIRRLEYRVLSKADYRPGRTYAKPISVPSFSEVYPKEPTGPDKLINSV